jgi:hypothetical protein
MIAHKLDLSLKDMIDLLLLLAVWLHHEVFTIFFNTSFNFETLTSMEPYVSTIVKWTTSILLLSAAWYRHKSEKKKANKND